jgi:hypothetical protein
MNHSVEVSSKGLQAIAKELRDEHFPDLEIGWVSFCHLPKDEFGRCYPSKIDDIGGRMILVNHYLRRNGNQLRETLIHEMIHLWLWRTRPADGTTHGPKFIAKCREIGLDVTRHC